MSWAAGSLRIAPLGSSHDRQAFDCGVGSLLLAAAVSKARLAAETVAMMAMVVDPIDDTTRRFYAAFGFRSLPGPEQRMFLTLACSGGKY